MANPGYRIRTQFPRPSPALIRQFEGIPVPNIGDCMERMAALSSRLRPLNTARLLGCAYTVDCPAGDNLLLYYAIDNAKPGDVIAVANRGYTERALCGEIMVTLAKKRGIAGLVIDGAIRDAEALAKMDIPVYAVAATPNGPYKNGPGEVNVPISVGDRIICPGDILIGDQDGIIAIKPEQAQQLYQKVQIVMEKEAAMMASIEKTGCLDLPWMYEKLEQGSCEIE